MREFIFAYLLLCFTNAGAESRQTLRVDYYHSGNALIEMFSLHQVVIEPLPWPGNPGQALDTKEPPPGTYNTWSRSIAGPRPPLNPYEPGSQRQSRGSAVWAKLRPRCTPILVRLSSHTAALTFLP